MQEDATPTAQIPMEMSQVEFLERQACDAKAAILETLRELLDPRDHIRQHPWWAIGLAGVAGVAAGRTLHRNPRGNHETSAKVQRAPGVMAPILKTVISEGIKFLIPTLFTGAFIAKAEDQINEVTDSAAATH